MGKPVAFCICGAAMGRLKQVKPQVRTIGPSVKIMTPVEQRGSWQRDNPQERAFYNTKAWSDLRWQVLSRDLFTCQWRGCGRVVSDTSKLVADHIVPVRIRPDLKWNIDNLRCLCWSCHSGPRQAEERAVYGGWGGGG